MATRATRGHMSKLTAGTSVDKRAIGYAAVIIGVLYVLHKLKDMNE